MGKVDACHHARPELASSQGGEVTSDHRVDLTSPTLWVWPHTTFTAGPRSFVATISRALAQADEQSVEHLRCTVRELVLERLKELALWHLLR